MPVRETPAGSPERVAALRVAHAALRLTLAQTGTQVPADQPQICCDATTSPPRVLDAGDAALRFGVRPGMVLREAMARCPTAGFHTTVPAVLTALQDRWLTALERVSPVIEPDGETLGAALLSAQGLAQLYGGELELVETLGKVTQRVFGLEPVIAIADGPFAARVATAMARAAAPAIVPPGHSPRFIAGASVDWLPLDPAAKSRLREQFAIDTIGEFAALPLGAVQAQFGPAGRAAWDLARGKDLRHLRVRHAPDQIQEQLEFPAPIVSDGALRTGVRHLLTRALQQPVRQQRAVRQISVWAQVEHGPRRERRSTLREPSADFGQLWIVARTQMDRLWQPDGGRLPGPVERIGLDLTGLCAQEGRQARLWTASRRQQPLIDAAARQLQARYGEPVLYRVAEMNPWSRFPERQTALIAYEA